MKKSSSPSPDAADEPNVTRKGKIAGLSLALRTELNRRLDDGWRGPQILDWLNSEPPVRAVLERHWSGQPINPQNLSEWRRGGYVDWRRQRDQVEKIRELAEYARELGEAAGSHIAEACATLAAARIMEAVETADMEDVLKMVRAIASLRSGYAARARLEQNERRLDQQQRSLNQRHQKIEMSHNRIPREMEERFEAWARDKNIRAILDSNFSQEEKLARLDRALFWKLDEDDESPADAVPPHSPAPGPGPGGSQVLAAGLLTCGEAILLLPDAQDSATTQFTSTQIKADQAISGIVNPSPLIRRSNIP